MSLPTFGKFYKGDKIVGVGFCNPGWFVSPEALKYCVVECMDDAWDRYRPENKEKYAGKENVNDEYFTTEQDLKEFEYVEIFEIKIPRHIALHVYFGQMSFEQWVGFLVVERDCNIGRLADDKQKYIDAYAQYIISNMNRQKAQEDERHQK